MMFDFSKFTTMTAETVESAFGDVKPNDVISDIANEVKSINQNNTMQQPTTTNQVNIPQQAINTNQANTVVQQPAATPEQIKQQAQMLKEQKEKSEEKEKAAASKANKSNTTKSKSTKAKASSTKAETKEKEPAKPIIWSRPRRVVAYGEDVYVETNQTATLEDIRETLANRFGYSEFRDPNRCEMRFDAKTGEVYPHIIFNKKG